MKALGITLVASAMCALAACKAKPAAQALPVTAASLDVAPQGAPSSPHVAVPAVPSAEGARAVALLREAAPPRCTGTKLRVLQNDDLRCAYVCAADRECLGGTTCQPAIALTDAAGEPKEPTFTKVCSDRVEGGNPGGGAATVPSLFGAAHGASGKCPSGFAVAPKVGALCYRACKIDRECPESSSCKLTEGVKLCRAD